MKITLLVLALIGGALFVNAQSDGTLDVSFNSTGMVTLDNGNNGDDDGTDLVLLADKGIVVGGTSSVNGFDLSFCALTSSGAVNTSFGINGKVIIDIDNGSNDYLNAMALDSSGKIVGVGYCYIGASEYLLVVRLNADGTLDSDFGTDGIALLDPVLVTVAYDVAIQPDGKIVIVGYVSDGLTPQKTCIVRLNDDGTYDGSFGDNGIWEGNPDPGYDANANSVALQSDGKILIGGYEDVNGDDEFIVGRILPGGSQDTGFDGDGWAVKNLTTSDDDIIHALVVQDDEKIVAAGESNGKVAVWRLNSDGTDDTGFADNSTFVDPLLANDDYLYAAAMQPDGKIIAGGLGSINDNTDFLLLRLDTDGILDPTFDDDGVVYTDVGGSNDWIKGMALQPDEKIVVAGTTLASLGTDFAAARYGSGATAIEDPFITGPILVYPNPSDGNFSIKILRNGTDELTWTLGDMTGRNILSGRIESDERTLPINMNHAPAGIYSLELRNSIDPSFVVQKKIVVN